MLAALVIGLLAPGATRGLSLNGFLPPPRQGAVAFSFTGESYDRFWVGGDKVSDPGLGEVQTGSSSVWLTWGLTEDLSVVGNFAFVDVEGNGTAGFHDDGPQDATALLQYRLASLRRPGARHDFIVGAGGCTPMTDYEPNAPVARGDGTSDVLLRFVYHLESGRFYLAQQVGYDIRGGAAPDGLPFFTEVGYTVGRLTFSGFYADYRAEGGTDIGDPGFTFPSNRDEYQRVGAKVLARFGEGLGIVLQGFDTVGGRNSGDATGVSLGGSFAF